MRLLSLLAIGCLVAACGGARVHAQNLTQAHLDRHGTRVFTGVSAQHAYDACKTVLAMEGYRINVDDPQRGLLVTAPRLLQHSARAGGGSGVRTVTTAWFRAYTVQVIAAGPQMVKVVMRPSLFKDSVDISAYAVWSPGTERALWQRMFAGVAQRLGVR